MKSSTSFLAAARTEVRRQEAVAAQIQSMRPHPRPTMLTQEAIFEAWKMLSPAGQSVLTKSQVLDNLRVLFPNLTAREVRELVGAGNMSIDKLTNLLLHSDVPAVDENAEAFKLLDPEGTGYIDVSALRKLLEQVHGMSHVDESDMELVMQLCDADGDGRISLRDFATIGSWAPVKEMPTATTRKLMLDKLKSGAGIPSVDD